MGGASIAPGAAEGGGKLHVSPSHPEKVIGQNTTTAMQSGIFYGYAVSSKASSRIKAVSGRADEGRGNNRWTRRYTPRATNRSTDDGATLTDLGPMRLHQRWK